MENLLCKGVTMNLPKEFEEKMKTLLGSEYEEYTACYDEPRHYGLRVNTAKISVEDFLKIAPWPLEPVPWIENGFYYDGDHIQPSKHPYYFAGLYYLQEPSAMTPASRLPVEPGDRVLDVCAAPGGKATELGAKLQGTGVLAANDLSSSRAKGLLKNLERLSFPKSRKASSPRLHRCSAREACCFIQPALFHRKRMSRRLNICSRNILNFRSVKWRGMKALSMECRR